MRKVGLIALALVLALGSLGVGYAMWSDTVTINGSVTTGNVDLDIVGVSSTYIYKVVDDITNESGEVVEAKGGIISSTEPMDLEQDDPPDSVNDLELIACAVTTANTAEEVEEVHMVFDNIFPTPIVGPIIGDVELHYYGSVPAHIAYSESWTGDDLSAYLVKTWDYVANPQSDRVSQDDINPADIQLHYCDSLYLEIYLDPALLQEAGVDAQGLSGDFFITIMAHQWNEEP
jgi:predicted ribosomally synthesized peptide with SipW-like signal peptide